MVNLGDKMSKILNNFLEKIEENNIQYIVETDYDGNYNCEENDCDNDICRCFKIEDAFIKNMNIKELNYYFSGLNSKIKKFENVENLIDLHCMISICNKYNLYSPETWHVNVEDSYYGDEINGVSIEEYLKEIIKEEIKHIITLND
jgi:hypothetical protein